MITRIAVLFLTAITSLSAQQKDITLEEIWSGTFRTSGLDVLRSLKSGKEYSVLNYDRNTKSSTIDVYNYNNGDKVQTLVNSNDLPGITRISSYEFSKDESKLLLATSLDQIYRRSVLGTYYVYDINSKSLSLVSENKIQEPTFNNDASKIAYGYANNLYVRDIETGNTMQITDDGKKNGIINGITDWVYEEEFAFVRAFDWNKDGTKIAFIRFDETEVPEFSMDVYGKELYQTQQVFKYPKAGEANSDVSLHIYNLDSEETTKVDVSGYNSYYIPRIEWTNDSDILSAQLTNRHQNVLDLVFVDTKRNTTSLILKLINQITNGDWEVTDYYGFDQNTGRIYYQSTENGSITRDLYSVLASGKNTFRLSNQIGNNSGSFSADFSLYINTFSNSTTPYTYTLHESLRGEQLREIVNNDGLKNALSGYKVSPKEFSTINVNGNDLNMYMIKPLDFDPNKEYPLFMYQYSGPGSQQVANKWASSNDYWHQMLAQEGFIIACIDGRGTGLKGRDFKKMTQKELGKFEVEDQIAAAQKLGNLSYIDKNRIGIWGWSYGGFMSSNCLFQGADTFAMAIAVAPVSSWRFYDTIYTERYMETPQENPSGYDQNSPIFHVDKMQGDFLLVHGSADDNVHVQNTTRLVEALVQADKDFDWAVYPDKNHGIYGGNTRLHLYKKMTRFIKETLGGSKGQSVKN